jgi:hypothetical protein
MPSAPHSISQIIQELVSKSGLAVVTSESGSDFNGSPTLKLELKSRVGSTHSVEISESLGSEIDAKPKLREGLSSYLHALAKRLQSPRADVFLTLHGLPLAMQQFKWPYHGSTSGADSFILHGIAQLADPGSPLHAKIAASLTVTFAEVLPALEQPYAEGVTFNAIRKTLDLGQLEMLKSGNRQPVPVSTRYFSYRQERFIFNETGEEARKEFVRTKAFWLSARLGERKPAWIADPYDAQYLDCSPEELGKSAAELSGDGWLTLDSSGEYATATEKLASEGESFLRRVEAALALLKPKFNEEMRAGHTNM